jgi:hypothetical protein
LTLSTAARPPYAKTGDPSGSNSVVGATAAANKRGVSAGTRGALSGGTMTRTFHDNNFR